MYAKFLGVEIYIEVGRLGSKLFAKPLWIQHNETNLEIRILKTILIMSKGVKHDTYNKDY